MNLWRRLMNLWIDRNIGKWCTLRVTALGHAHTIEMRWEKYVVELVDVEHYLRMQSVVVEANDAIARLEAQKHTAAP